MLKRKSARSSQETHHSKLARATKASLKRGNKNLGSNYLFQLTSNLFQTCPTHPKTLIQTIKGRKCDTDNNNHPRNRVRNTINNGGKIETAIV
ncbi:hypothetical protein HYC85_028565 [Camellia sinensis]|uniref:Uncharacterized protein n=1 Tax=Camellia sinensis TaxID=4442 RepID=A0A7J7FZJ3_CAMSI|nr:hypothetical protein HYC85_028565 [Camellia sinensis]